MANKFILSLAWRFEKFTSFLKRKEPFLTKETANASKNKITYENSKITKLLNYTFTDIDDTIQWVTRDIMDNLKVKN